MIPLTLYIHLPWCVRKCPYCDFNSHAFEGSLPEELYINALLRDLESSCTTLPHNNLSAIFFGGGTPSLFSATGIERILNAVQQKFNLNHNIEVTMEANPGTFEQQRFADYFNAGVNRLSIGIQSFHDKHLKTLGRIHGGDEAKRAIDVARQAGFENFNCDLMFGLPQQSLSQALDDLNTAIAFAPTHISWYQLTLEPNTVFYKYPPTLPSDDNIWEMQQQGIEQLAKHGFSQYEVSAYSQANRQCHHNLNYWEFGDYLGIGAGAHSKLSYPDKIIRQARAKQPKSYMDPYKEVIVENNQLSADDLQVEFMMNALRLTNAVPLDLYEQRTYLKQDSLTGKLKAAEQQRLLTIKQNKLQKTQLGHQYLNNLVEIFLPDT